MSGIMDSTELDLFIRSRLPEKRYLHSVSVAETAVMLAGRFNISEEDARIVGLYHDAYRYVKKEDAIKDLEKHGFIPYPEEIENESLLHAPVAAVHMRDDIGNVPESYIKAVRFHTLGSKDMGTLGAVLYIADYSEPRRRHLSDEERKSIYSHDSLEGMVCHIIREQNMYFKREGISNAKVTDELYSFLLDGGRFEG